MKLIDRKRAVGLEHEFGLLLISVSKSTTKAIGNIVNLLGLGENNLDYINRFQYTKNGSRFYLDNGSHPEISTPECNSVYDLVKYDAANCKILEEKEKSANNSLSKSKIKFHLVKNNYDFIDRLKPNASFGCHENYQTLATCWQNFDNTAERIAPFLATRQIINGSGALHQNRFLISGRALATDKFTDSSNIEGARPMILNRAEHFAPAEFVRLQIICGDSNMLEWAVYLTVGSTRLILEMIENNFLKNLKMYEQIGLILAEISKDINLKNKYRTNFGQLSAIQIQEFYLAEVKKWLEHLGNHNLVADEDLRIVQMWEETLNLLKTDHEQLVGKIDWISKKHLIEDYCLKKNLNLSDIKVQMLNLQYHFLDWEKSLSNLLYKNGLAYKIVPEEEIEEAKNNPPKDTRAYVRTKVCEILQNFEGLNYLSFNCYWDRILVTFSITGDANKNFTLFLNDPLNANLESALSYLRQEGLPI